DWSSDVCSSDLERSVCMDSRRLGEKSLEVAVLPDLLLQAGLAVAGQPADDLVNLFPGAILSFRFLNIQRVDLGERCRENSMPGHPDSSNVDVTRVGDPGTRPDRRTLAADLQRISRTLTMGRASGHDVPGGDHLYPERAIDPVVRSATGVAQCIQTVHRGTGVGSGESRQLEHHP